MILNLAATAILSLSLGYASTAIAATATAATVTSAPLVKAPFDTKRPLYITSDGGFACPEGFELYVRASKPEPKDKKAPPAQGDFESFYFARSANPDQPAIIVSRPGMQEYTPACLQVK